MHVTYSETIKGVGLFNGALPFGGLPGGYQSAVDLVNEYSTAGTIDNISNLNDSPVYIIGG
jgi:hypothetical protein